MLIAIENRTMKRPKGRAPMLHGESSRAASNLDDCSTESRKRGRAVDSRKGRMRRASNSRFAMRRAFGVHALACWLTSDTLKGGHQTRRVAYALVYCAAAVVLAGCTASQYRRSADKEVYRIIGEKQEHTLGHAT